MINCFSVGCQNHNLKKELSFQQIVWRHLGYQMQKNEVELIPHSHKN